MEGNQTYQENIPHPGAREYLRITYDTVHDESFVVLFRKVLTENSKREIPVVVKQILNSREKKAIVHVKQWLPRPTVVKVDLEV
jgi:hypothetical protein